MGGGGGGGIGPRGERRNIVAGASLFGKTLKGVFTQSLCTCLKGHKIDRYIKNSFSPILNDPVLGFTVFVWGWCGITVPGKDGKSVVNRLNCCLKKNSFT